jgi:hypothetical protein
MGKPRIYEDCPDTYAFSVRVHRKATNSIEQLATRLGVSPVEAKRLIVETGLKALQAA